MRGKVVVFMDTKRGEHASRGGIIHIHVYIYVYCIICICTCSCGSALSRARDTAGLGKAREEWMETKKEVNRMREGDRKRGDIGGRMTEVCLLA